MDAGEPKLFLPRQSSIIAGLSKLFAIVGSTFPSSAHDGSRQCVLSRQKKDASTRLQNSIEFAQTRTGVRQMLKHPTAGDAFEGTLTEWELHQIGRNIAWTIVFQTTPCTTKHLMRKIASDQFGRRTDFLQKVSQDLPGPGSDIQNTAV